MTKHLNDDYPLAELHRSGYEVAFGEPDVRGWKVKNIQGQTIGEVVELLFDPLSQSVRYLIVNIEGKPINLISRDILVPIGLADLLEETSTVVVPSVTLGQLAALPTYKRSELDHAFERMVRQVFTGDTATRITTPQNAGPEFYDHDHFRRDNFYKPKNRHHVIVEDLDERDPVIPAERVVTETTTPQSEFAPFREGTIELTEHGEVPVITKEARVVEEVKVNRDVTEREETVRDKIRRTEVDVERIPRDDL